MIGPPSLSFKVGRSRWQTAAGSLFLVLGVAVLLGMTLSPHHFSARAVASAVFAVACSGLVFYRTWRNAPIGVLHWDGTHWHWSDSVDYSVQGVRVTMDLQRWVLIRLDLVSARPLWLWLEQGNALPSVWIAMRRALVYAGRQVRSSPSQAQDEVYP